ncbi:MAG: hypothetical protein ABH864_05100 [archaeon]
MARDRKLEAVDSAASKLIAKAREVATPLDGRFARQVEDLEGQIGGVYAAYADKLAHQQERGAADIAHGIAASRWSYFSDYFPEEPGEVKASFGGGNDGVRITLKYSGVPNGSIWSRISRNGGKKVTLNAEMQYYGETRMLAPLEIDIPSDGKRREGDDFEMKVATYLHDVAINAVTELVSRTKAEPKQLLDRVGDFAWFEADLVLGASNMLRTTAVAREFLVLQGKDALGEAIRAGNATYEEGAAAARAELEKGVSELKRCAATLEKDLSVKLAAVDGDLNAHQAAVVAGLDAAKAEILERLGTYETERRQGLDVELLTAVRAEQSRLEKEVGRQKSELQTLNAAIAARRGEPNAVGVYLLGEMDRFFPDYNPERTEYDVTPEKRAEQVGVLSKALGDNSALLNEKDAVQVLAVLTRNVQGSGHAGMHNAIDMRSLVDEVKWVASRLGHEHVGDVVDRINSTGKNGRRKIAFGEMQKVVRAVVGK